MRRIVMFNHVSADGCFAGADGNLDWIVQDDEVDKAAMEGGPGADTFLLGRRTYELFASFWPQAVDNPNAQAPHGGGELSETQRQMAVGLNEMTKLVFSKTLKKVTWKNSRLIPKLDAREIEAMKKQPGQDMLILGSGSIVSQLTQHGLIDEYHLVVNPIVLGNGRPLLTDVSKSLRLKLLKAREFKSGCMMLNYARGK
jgi:dihydrofolate reductase